MNTRNLFFIISFAFILFCLLYGAYIFSIIIAPFLIAYILHFVLKPFVYYIEQKDIKHSSSVLLVFSFTFLLFILVLAFLIPALAREVSNIQENMDVYSKTLTDKYVEVQKKLLGTASPLNMLMKKKNIREEMDVYVKNKFHSLLRKLTQYVFSILSFVMYLIVIPFATFFFLMDEERIKKMLIGMIPNRYFEMSLKILHNLHLQFGMILRGMLISVVIISILSSIGLWIIGLKYPIIIGVFAGLSNLIPFFGPIAGTFVAFVVALVTGANLVMFLNIVIVFIVVQILDNVFVQPIVFSKATNIHPLTVMFLVLVGSNFGGIMGMFLIIPTVSLLQVVVSIAFKELSRPMRPPFSEYRDVT